MSGDLDPLATGVVYCELVCALQGLGQYDVAEQWTEAMERWCETSAVGSLHGRCRVHRAEILRLRGSCTEAEDQALMACEELRPYLGRELGWPLNELGRIRLHKGDVAGAEEALLASHRAGWDPQPDLALARLAQGDVPTALASIRDALERPLRVPSKERPPNTDLQRAPLLEAQVEIEIAAGHIDRARSAADELDVVAGRFENKPLAAAAALARGRVRLAEGDAAGAEQSLSDAVRLWNEVGAPYEAAHARMSLAAAHAARGSEHRAALERQAARSILAGIEGAPPPRRPGRPGSPAGSPDVFRREGDYWTVVFDGQTVRVRDLKGMHYLARLLAEPGREHHVLDLVAAETGRGDASPTAGRTTCRSPRRATRASFSTHRQRRPTGGVSPRSTRTSPKRARSGTSSEPRRRTPNATSSCRSSPAPSGSVVVDGVLRPRPSVPGPVSPARSARRWRGSLSTIQGSVSISTARSAPARTAPTRRIPAQPRDGTCPRRSSTLGGKDARKG